MITLMKLSPFTGDIVAPSPNHDARRAPTIEGIVLHATADDGNEALSLSWMRSPNSRVSCHLFVSRTGRVTRLVGDRDRAWHAGLSMWRGTSDVNSITLGIELANRNDGEPYTDAQYREVAEIVAHYCGQGLSLDDVVSHEQIAEGRKSDPFGWDWDAFRAMVRDRMMLSKVAGYRPSIAPGLEPRKVTVSAVPAAVALPKEQPALKTQPKLVLQSRTLWLNTFTVLAAGGLLVGDTLDLAHRVGIRLPEEVAKWALFCMGIVNIILRLRTSRPLTCSQDLRPSPSGARMNGRKRS